MGKREGNEEFWRVRGGRVIEDNICFFFHTKTVKDNKSVTVLVWDDGENKNDATDVCFLSFILTSTSSSSFSFHVWWSSSHYTNSNKCKKVMKKYSSGTNDYTWETCSHVFCFDCRSEFYAFQVFLLIRFLHLFSFEFKLSCLRRLFILLLHCIYFLILFCF